MAVKTLISLLIFLVSLSSFAQLQNISGKVIGTDDIENIHVLNKTALKYTVTDTDGSFIIPAKVNDTLIFTGIVYKDRSLVITSAMIQNNNLKVYLEENINQLDDVLVGKILTGNLDSDITNTEVKTDINFYNLGIPGYTGKQKTLSERKLYAATSSGGGIPLIGIINAISGKTKALKNRVKLEKDIKCVNRFKSAYREMIFEGQELSAVLQERFFNFILDSENLQKACRSRDAFTPITFLKEELELFKLRLNSDDKKD